MGNESVLLAKEGKIGLITINRPEVRNALSPETVHRFKGIMDKLKTDEDILVVIITGAGEKSFVSGSDISALKEKTFLDQLNAEMHHLYHEIEYFEKPVIAAINGYALGGGCELSMACDIRIASSKAKFGLPELNLGIIPGAGGTQRMAKLVGMGKAKELIFTGEIIDAEEAYRIGLVQKVVPAEQLQDAAKEVAGKIINKGPLSLKLAKVAINSGDQQQAGYAVERMSQSILFATEDKHEGVTAFMEKRKPEFKGK